MRQILLFAALATSLALLSGCTLSNTKADTAEDMTGKAAYHKISAEEAYRIGLINRLTDKGGALSEAKAMVKIYEQRAPLSLAFVKRTVHRGMQMDLASAIEFETFLVTAIYGTEDRLEGIGAFLEKRQAQFKGR